MDSFVPYERLETQPRKPKLLIIAGAGILLVIVLLAAILVAGIGIGIIFSRHDQTPTKTLHNVFVTEEELMGEYSDSNGGIMFHSEVNSTHSLLNITAVNGEPVVSIVHNVVSNMTLICINGTNFMLIKTDSGYNDYVVSDEIMYQMESLMFESQSKLSNVMLEQFDNSTANETRDSVLYNVAMSQETIDIIEAAHGLGNMGIQGWKYPATMHFYLLALQLAKFRGSNITGGNTESYDHQNRTPAQ